MLQAEINLCLSAIHILQHEFHENGREHGFWNKKCSKCIDGKTVMADHSIIDCTYCVNGFIYDPASFNKAEKIALMHSELSEALEGIRHPCKDKHIPKFDSTTVELADCIIRILDYAAAYHLDLGDAMLAKHEFNKTREHLHGKRF